MNLVDPKMTLSSQTLPLKEQQWEKFLSDLHEGRCCLLLGPEIPCITPKLGGPEISVMSAFSEYLGERMTGELAGKLAEKNIEYDAGIGSFYYRAEKYIKARSQPGKEYDFNPEISSFAKSVLNVQPAIFSKLAKLPFHSIINMTPDNFMSTSLRENGYAFKEEFYHYRKPRPFKVLDERVRMIYNLFGSYQDPESIILTQRDEISFIKSVTKMDPEIPISVTKRFRDKKKSYLFLGFDFNDWYFRLVIDALEIPKPAFSYYPLFSEHHKVAVLTREFYSDRFGIEFLESDTLNFLNAIVQGYESTYRAPERKLSVILDFCPEDATNEKHFNALLVQLQLTGIARRVSLWRRDNNMAGDKVSIADQVAKESDVYIPFLSAEFLSDRHCSKRLEAALDQEHTQVIPIYLSSARYESLFPQIKDVLPERRRPLRRYTGNNLTQAYHELALLINYMIW